MRPEPTVIDGEPVSTIEVKAGQTLFDIRDQYNESTLARDKKITVEDIRRFNDIPLDGMFGKKPSTELKLPIRRETEVDKLRRKVEQERSIEKARIEFERLPEAQKEKIRDSTGCMNKHSQLVQMLPLWTLLKLLSYGRRKKLTRLLQQLALVLRQTKQNTKGC